MSDNSRGKKDGKGPHLFDRWAETCSRIVAEAPFFVACVALVVLWLPTFPFVKNLDTWQLLINTPTTVVTFLLVALLQNSTRRNEIAVQKKLDALAHGIAGLLEHSMRANGRSKKDLKERLDELTKAVGLEKRVSA